MTFGAGADPAPSSELPFISSCASHLVLCCLVSHLFVLPAPLNLLNTRADFLKPPASFVHNNNNKLGTRRPCTMLICLGQQDPTMRCGGHVRKAARSARVGMTVLQVSADALGRRWEVKPHEVAAETGLTAAREVVVELKAEPGHAYVVVPYASAPGEEAAFVLRAFCSAPVEVEQLPSPLSLIIGGQWVGQLAGGDRHQPTWGSNPQYMLSTQHRAQALISVSRSDIAYSIIKPRPKADEYVGYVLVKPEVQPDGLGRRAAVREDAGELLAEVGYSHNEEALQLVTLEAETPYVLVPSLASAGVEAPFEVRILSATPVELIPLPEVKAVVLDGSWDEATSGGCDLNPAWRKNPRFLLQLEGQPGASYPVKTSIRVTLARKAAAVHKGGGAATRSGHPRARGVPVDEMIGFYVIRADDSTMSPAGDLKRAMLAETAFVPEVQLSETLTLMAPGSYLLVPCTYAPGKLGGFTLGVTCRENFMLTRLA